MFEIFLDMEIKRQKDACALKCIKESVDVSLLPLISDANIAKEAWDTLERCFGARGSIEVEDQGGFVAADLQRDEESEEAEREHEDACEPHCTQLHVDDDLMIPATELADEDLMIPTTWLVDEYVMIPATELADDMVIPATQFVDDDLLIQETQLADDDMAIPATELADDMVNPETNIVDFDREFLANDEWLQMMQQKQDIDMMLFGEITPLQLVEDNLFAAAQVSEE